MSAEIYKKTLDFAETTSIALKLASDLLNQQQQKQASADTQAAEVAELLKSAELITDREVSSAVTKLSQADGALDVLRNVVAHYTSQPKTASAGIEGRGVTPPGTKPARNPNYMGERTSVKAASDQELYDRLVLGKRK